MIRSRDVIFNERMMYKDRHNTSASDSKHNGPVYAQIYDVLESRTIESSQLEHSIESSNEKESDTSEHSTPTPSLRRSSRTHMPNRRYMDYMLLAYGGEP